MLKLVLLSIIVGGIGICLAQTNTIWECNYCHQQYIGNSPPPFAKCPAKDNKTNHWWIRKSKINQ